MAAIAVAKAIVFVTNAVVTAVGTPYVAAAALIFVDAICAHARGRYRLPEDTIEKP